MKLGFPLKVRLKSLEYSLLKVSCKEHYELHRDFIYPVLTVSAFDGVSLQGQFVPMACSRLGSRVLEAIWNSASVTHRHNMAQELGNKSSHAS